MCQLLGLWVPPICFQVSLSKGHPVLRLMGTDRCLLSVLVRPCAASKCLVRVLKMGPATVWKATPEMHCSWSPRLAVLEAPGGEPPWLGLQSFLVAAATPRLTLRAL